MSARAGGSLSFGSHANIESLIRARTASKVGQAALGVEEKNEAAREQAKRGILNFLINEQGTASQLMQTYWGMQNQMDISGRQLAAQESGCALVAALYGGDSIDEYMLKLWEKMHIKMNRGKIVRRRVYWNWFRGYHWIAPKIVSATPSGALRRAREGVTRRFVRYCARDIFKQRQNPLDVAAAILISAMSTLGWGLKKWQERTR